MAFSRTAQALSFFALLNSATAQSANPGVGTNPDAQGATENVTPSTGPNGAEWWFNSGIDNGQGWSPPYLNFASIKHISKETFYGGAGQRCAQYDWAFGPAGSEFDIDPAILAFIAQQESSCNADASGPTPGLMQVACSNYPDGVCHPEDIQLNVRMGAKYLRDRLNDSNNNILAALGNYNGWFQAGSGLNGNKGLTEEYPCSEEGKGNGAPQNLDYLHEQLNGWFMGLDPYGAENWIGTYDCSGTCAAGKNC